MRILVLGPVAATDDDVPVHLGGAMQRRVLALLVAAAGRPLTAGTLVERVWPGQPPTTARKTLQGYVHHLRRALDGGILSDQYGYRLDPASTSVDAADFEETVAAVSAGRVDPPVASRRLAEALSWWRGAPYEDVVDTPAIAHEAARLTELRLAALEERIDADLALGGSPALVGELTTLADEYPLRERLATQLLHALYQTGRQAEALARYDRLRDDLLVEHGLDPFPALVEMHRRILHQDPQLLPTKPSAPAAVAAIRGYELREVVARTGDWTTRRAFQTSMERQVALEIVTGPTVDDRAFVDAFPRVMSTTAELTHPNLVTVLDSWREPGSATIVWEWLDGGTLADGGRGLSAAALEQVAAALAHVHRAGLAHGRVRADHVLFDAEGNAFLGGLPAGMLEPARAGPEVAPEVAAGGDPAAASDIHALGHLVGTRGEPMDPLDPLVERFLDRARAADPAERPSHVDELVRALRRADGRDVTGLPGSVPTSATRNPFKGLRAFGEADAADFFGRDELIQAVVDAVAAHDVVTVVGPSGGGKSSLLRAGVLPALREVGGRVLTVDLFPGPFPLDELARAVETVAVRPVDGLGRAVLVDDRALLRVLKEVLPDHARLVVVVDQFEEVFSLVGDDAVRRAFVANLVTAAQAPTCPLRLVVAVRADYFGHVLAQPGLGPIADRGLVSVRRMTDEELGAAIARPANRVGVWVESALVTRIVADLADQPGVLPLLQYALTELFSHRADGELTLAAYDEIGGVTGALSVRAEAVYAGLSDDARRAARPVLLRLVTVDDHADDLRRRVRLRELESLELPAGAVRDVLDELGRARLLSFDHDPRTRGPTVEVAHEALLREWPRLRGWIDDARDDLVHRRLLTNAVGEWVGAERDDSYLPRGVQLAVIDEWAATTAATLTSAELEFLAAARAARDAEAAREEANTARLRRRLAGLAVVTVVALVAGATAAVQTDRARDEAAAAEVARSTTETRRLAAQAPRMATTNRQLALLLAVEAHRRDPNPETLGALQSVLVIPDGYRGHIAGGPVAALTVAASGDAVVADDRVVRVHRPDGTERGVLDLPGVRQLATGTGGGPSVALTGSTVHVLDLEDDPTVVHRLDADTDQLVSVTVARSGRLAAAGDAAGDVWVWDLGSGSLLRRLRGVHPERRDEAAPLPPHAPDLALFGVRTIAISDDDRWVATGGLTSARVHDIDSGALVGETRLTRPTASGGRGNAAVRAVAFDADSSDRVVVASAFSALPWDVGDARPDVTAERVFPDTIDDTSAILLEHAVAIGQGGAVLASPGGATVSLPFDRASPPTTFDAQVTGRPVVALSPTDGSVLVGGSEGVTRWQPGGGSLISRPVRGLEHISMLTFTIDGEQLLVNTSGAEPVRVVDLRAERLVADPLADDVADPIGFGGPDRRIATFDFTSGRATVRDLDGHGDGLDLGDIPFITVEASAARGWMAFAGGAADDEAVVVVVDVRTGDQVARLHDLEPAGDSTLFINSLAFDRAGERLVGARTDGAAVMWDTSTWEVVTELSSGGGQVVTAEFSPSGRFLATEDAGGVIVLRDADSLQPVGPPLIGAIGIGGASDGPVFSEDERWLVTTGDGVGRLFDLTSRQQVGTAIPNRRGVVTRPSVDGRLLATVVGADVHVWELDPDTWSGIACRAAGRNLTRDEWHQFGPSGETYATTCPQWPAAPTGGTDDE